MIHGYAPSAYLLFVVRLHNKFEVGMSQFRNFKIFNNLIKYIKKPPGTEKKAAGVLV